MDENFVLMAMMPPGPMSPLLCKLPRACLLLSNPLPLKLLFIGSHIFLIGRGVVGVFRPSGEMLHITACLIIPERFRSLLLTIAMSEIRATKTFSQFWLEDFTLLELLCPYLVKLRA